MPIYYTDILEQKTEPRTFSYGDKEVMLYALEIGMGRDPMNERELPFVYEKDLRVVPTAATVLSSGVAQRAAPATRQRPGLRTSDLNLLTLVHGEQKVELHKPLPSFGTFTAASRTSGAYDKGKDKGAVVVDETVGRTRRVIRSPPSPNPFSLADGGFGGPSEAALCAHAQAGPVGHVDHPGD